jgi:DNA-binding beta-propeller fold protein YncE
MDYPHGGFVSPDGSILYLTSQNGNFINKINLSSGTYDIDPVVLIPGQSPSTSSSLDPHEIILSPDGTKYFVSCQKSNEVRVFQISNDSLIGVIPVGEKPQELGAAQNHPYLFVSCTEEPIDAFSKGKVYVIDYNNLSIITSLYTGYQPHGIAVNDDDNLVYVTNLNYDPNGPAPHHVSSCAGRNGDLKIIDLQTLQMYQHVLSNGSAHEYRCELLPFPYFVAYKR